MPDMQHKYTEWVKAYARQYWYLILVAIVLAFVSIFFELVTPLPLKFLADNVFGQQAAPSILGKQSRESLLLIAISGYVAINGVGDLYRFLNNYLSRRMTQIIDARIGVETLASIVGIPYNGASRKANGTYLYQISGQSQQMSEFLITNAVLVFQAVVTMIAISVVLANIDVKLMIIIVAALPLLTVSIIYFSKLFERRSVVTENAHSAVFDSLTETLEKLRTIQAYTMEKLRLNAFMNLVLSRNKAALQQLVSNNLFDDINQLIILTAVAIAIYVGGHSVFRGQLTFGDLIIFISYMSLIFEQITILLQTYSTMKEQAVALQQVYDSVSSAHQIMLSSGTNHSKLEGAISFKNVTITRDKRIVLDCVNFDIRPNTITAFVGPSGNGKSTIASSLLRFVLPQAGFITIDGHNIEDFDLVYLRQNIGLIEQEPDLFNLTVAENIAVSDPDKANNLPDIMAAAVVTNCATFIDAMQEGFATQVDDEKLSGGQKQRLAIARAYYKKAPIIIMDEPTSALDKRSADIFIANLPIYFANKTVIMITHDLQLLDKISQIFVVADGSVRPIGEYGGLAHYESNLMQVLKPS